MKFRNEKGVTYQILIIIILFIIIIIALGIYFYAIDTENIETVSFRNTNKKITPVEVNSEFIIDIIPILSNGQIISYRDPDHGFSLKVPADWAVRNRAYMEIKEGSNLVIASKSEEDSDLDLYIKFYNNDDPSLADWVSKHKSELEKKKGRLIYQQKMVADQQEVFVFYFNMPTIDPINNSVLKNNYYTQAYIDRNNKVYEIKFIEATQENKKYSEAIDAIIESFKFIETQETDSPKALPSQIDGEIMYATKEGKEVQVVRNDLKEGTKTEVLKYQEDIESDFGGNYWTSRPPSIDLSGDQKDLAFVSEAGLTIYNLDSKESEVKFFKTSNREDTDLTLPTWSYEELPDRSYWGFYDIFIPRWSFDKKYVALVLSHWEGSTNGVYNIAENTLDILRCDDIDTGGIGRHRLHWANNSNKIILGSDDYLGYSNKGFFVGEGGNYYQAKNLASTIGRKEGQFFESAWSQDDSKIVLVVGDSPEFLADPQEYTLAITNPEGTTYNELITLSKRPDSLIFYKNSEIYYYLDSFDDSKDGLWKINVDGTGNVQVIKDDLSVIKPLGWYNDRYLVYLAISKYASDEEKFYVQVNIYDRQDDKIVYQGEASKNRLTFLDLTLK